MREGIVKKIMIFTLSSIALGQNFTYCMYQKKTVEKYCFPGQLNVPRLISKMKAEFYLTSQSEDIKTLQGVLKQYHPNAHDNITGGNLQKLYRMAERSQKEFEPNTAYSNMLNRLCVLIKKLFSHQTDDHYFLQINDETQTCTLCQDPLLESIQTECKHFFCYECLFNWYIRNERQGDCHSRCPLCRTLLPEQIKQNIRNDSMYEKIRKKVLAKRLREELEALMEEQRQVDASEEEDYFFID